MSESTRLPTYRGDQKLVLCIDVGTTHTGCSIIRYDPGTAPTIRVINRYPGDPASSKIPTRMFYDKTGTPRAYGSEVFNEVIVAQAEAEGWELAAFWKLHLHPEGLNPPSYTLYDSSDAPTEAAELGSSNSKFDISPLPKNVPLRQIYCDWFKWLVKAAQQFYEETNADGEALWTQLSAKMEFVVAHPNGYGLSEQTVLRKALEDASLIKADDEVGEQRLSFVTEAECSVYFGLEHSPYDWLKIGSQLAVVDLGGSTVDITVYSVDQVVPKLLLHEAKISSCIQAGGIYVTQAGRQLIQAKLRNSRFLEDLDVIVSEFDTKTKCNFSGAGDTSIIKFGLARDNDSAVNISRGRLTLTGAEVEQAFSACLENIIESLDEQLAGTTGFSESPYLKNKLRATYAGRGFSIIHVDEHSYKAVSEGAALFHIKGTVIGRVVRFAYGTEVSMLVSDCKDLGGRETFEDADGSLVVYGGWSELIAKGKIAPVGKTYSDYFIAKFTTEIPSFENDLVLYYSSADAEELPAHGGFMRDKDYRRIDGIRRLCTLHATLENVCKPKHNSTTGKDFFEVSYNVCIKFGGTSLKAHIEWVDDGVKKTGPVSIIPA